MIIRYAIPDQITSPLLKCYEHKIRTMQNNFCHMPVALGMFPALHKVFESPAQKRNSVKFSFQVALIVSSKAEFT